MKKRWILVPVTAGLLALVVTGGALFAQGMNHRGGGAYGSDLASRVAEILNLEKSEVQDAFNQATRESQNDRLQDLLDRLLEQERLSPEDADAIMGWYQARPEAASHLPGVLLGSEPLLERRLERMVQAGVITEAESEQVLDWYQDRPVVLPAVTRGAWHHRWGFHRGPGRWGKEGRDGREYRGPAPHQPMRERQDAQLQFRLERMVAEERLTQEQADAIIQWYRARPDAALNVPGILLGSGESLQRQVHRMVNAGVITEEEGEQVVAWHQQRPDVLPAIAPGPRADRSGLHHDRARGARETGPAQWFRGGPDAREFPAPAQRSRPGDDSQSFRGAPQGYTPPTANPRIFH